MAALPRKCLQLRDICDLDTGNYLLIDHVKFNRQCLIGKDQDDNDGGGEECEKQNVVKATKDFVRRHGRYRHFSARRVAEATTKHA